MSHDRRRVTAGLLGALVAVLCACAGLPAVAAASDAVDVTDPPYGAAGDGTTNDRPAIQAAIDDVGERGGGTVVLPEGGTFLSGSVVLRSRVTLRIDGTLLQSQRSEDYSFTPTRGHLYPSDIAYRYGDLAMLHNTPLVYAAHAADVSVEGGGTIQLTRALGMTPLEREHATIHLAAIGLYRVHDFAVRDVSMLGASSFSLGLYTVNGGIVEGTRIVASSEDANPVGGHNTDGISIQNAQQVRVTGNVVRTGDDGIYVWSSYRDERGGETSWWSSDVPQPSRNIEIDHNDVVVDRRGGRLCCGAVVLIAWGGAGSPTGGNAPDRRQVEISDIHVHDNHLEAGYPFRCWCGSAAGQSPITRVTLERNEYVWGSPQGDHLRAQITDFHTDADEWYPLMSAREVKNGDFEATGDAWWTPSGRAGATRIEEPALHSRRARERLAEAGGWVGYLRALPNEPAALMQGILPTSPQDLPIGVESVRHEVSADVVTSGTPVRLVVRDRCDDNVLAEQVVDAINWTRAELSFAVTSNECGGVRVGLESLGDHPGWALIDDIAHQVSYEGSWIDSADPRVRLTGSWGVYPGSQDIGGSHLVGFARGANLTVDFTGTRARLIGTRDRNLGMGDVFIDGVRHGTADFYAATRVDGVVVYDTGTLPPGEHVFELRTTGAKNPASTNIYTVFDALVIDD